MQQKANIECISFNIVIFISSHYCDSLLVKVYSPVDSDKDGDGNNGGCDDDSVADEVVLPQSHHC